MSIYFTFISLFFLYQATYGFELFDYFNSQKGKKSYQNKNYDDALASFSKLLNSRHHKAQNYSNLGNIYFKQGDFESAETAYDMASQLLPTTHPHQTVVDYNNGTTALKNQNYRSAIDYFKKVLRRTPQDHDAKHNLELALSLLKQEQEQNQQQQNQQQQQQNQQQQNQQQQQQQNQQQNKEDEEEKQASQLLDQLSQLEKEARKKHTKLPPQEIIIENDW